MKFSPDTEIVSSISETSAVKLLGTYFSFALDTLSFTCLKAISAPLSE
ncbi:MAG: hypothetical protein Q4B31_04425 [Clostridia bacterium]|nr:hypothetical protein [Clostridia bacterium]